MARGVNKAILVGNLGNDPETKYTQGGMAVCRCSVATTSVRKDRDGNNVEKTEWHRVVFFGKLGEIAGEYLKKGSQVYVEGRISYSESEGQDGVKRYFTDVIADELQMLGGGGDRGGSSGGDRGSARGGSRASPERQRASRGAQRGPAQQAPAQDFGNDGGFDDSDIPF